MLEESPGQRNMSIARHAADTNDKAELTIVATVSDIQDGA
jgi:hypothetical protein